VVKNSFRGVEEAGKPTPKEIFMERFRGGVPLVRVSGSLRVRPKAEKIRGNLGLGKGEKRGITGAIAWSIRIYCGRFTEIAGLFCLTQKIETVSGRDPGSPQLLDSFP